MKILSSISITLCQTKRFLFTNDTIFPYNIIQVSCHQLSTLAQNFFFTIFTIKSLPKQQFFSHQIKNVIKCNNYSLGFFVAHSGDNRTQNYCCVVCEKLRILEEIWVWTMKKRNFHTKSKIFGQLLTLSSQD